MNLLEVLEVLDGMAFLTYLDLYLHISYFYFITNTRKALMIRNNYDLITFQVIGVLVGGRLGYLFSYQGDKFVSDPLSILRVWRVEWQATVDLLESSLPLCGTQKNPLQNIKPIGDLIVSVVPPGLFLAESQIL